MIFKLLIAGFLCLLSTGCSLPVAKQTVSTPPPAIPCGSQSQPFPSYNTEFPPVEKWCGKTFQLSQDYLAATNKPDSQPWKRIVQNRDEFKTKWKAYLISVIKYAYEGNIESDWVVQNNRTRKWLHAPWMHSGITGREFVRGLTMERSSCLEELTQGKPCANNNVPVQNWAVSVYNEPGGYYIGKIWQEMYNPELDASKQNPQPDPANFPSEGFPEGTVAIKLLFTQADLDFLKKGVVWEADIYRSKADPQIMRLLQIDLAVRDNVSPTGWIFGTFIYHDKAPLIYDEPALTPAQQSWLRLKPLGLMFGNKPEENFLNSAEEIGVPQHFGCSGRLNGPVDNYQSSCVSCHSTAETSRDFSRVKYPFDMKCGTDADKFWFQNINPRSDKTDEKTLSSFGKSLYPNEAFQTTTSLDYSLQLRKGIERCCQAGICQCGQTPGAPKSKEVTRQGIIN